MTAAIWADIGSMLVGVAAILGVFVTIMKWMMNRDRNKQTDLILAATTAMVQKNIVKMMLDATEKLDPEKYYTHELCFPGDLKMFVPMIPGVPLPILENITIQVIAHNSKETILAMNCTGFGHIGQHSHGDTTEEIRIQSGMMTDLKTGKQYRKDDVWIIDPNVEHSATFQDCVAIVILRPPLPTAKERPVNMDDSEKIFKTE